MEALTQIQQLAKTISEGSDLINSHIQDNHLPQPSFDVDGPVHVRYGAPGNPAEDARINTINACLELSELLLGPSQLNLQTVC